LLGLRLKAAALLALSEARAAEAEECLNSAIAIARKQEAKFWELRATTALARLWAKRGRRSAARAVLGAVYGRRLRFV